VDAAIRQEQSKPHSKQDKAARCRQGYANCHIPETRRTVKHWGSTNSARFWNLRNRRDASKTIPRPNTGAISPRIVLKSPI
jgi:hypothetical protein